MWQWCWSYRDELGYCAYMQASIECLREARLQGNTASVRGALTNAELRLASSAPPYSLGTLIAMPPTSATVRIVARAETEKELVIAAIALKRFQLRHGKSPPNLTALVPEFLPEVPRDFMDGMPLRYRRNPDGSFLLYSVNEDGKDDGGDPNPPPNGQGLPLFGNGRDLVWPRAATPAKLDDQEQIRPGTR